MGLADEALPPAAAATTRTCLPVIDADVGNRPAAVLAVPITLVALAGRPSLLTTVLVG